jgi:DNA polymerase-3 subunit epsilon
MTWHTGTLVAYDLETDSPDPEDAHIVTACIAVIDGTGLTEPRLLTWVLKPLRDIPAGAAEIHGYDTARARAEGMDHAQGVRDIATRLGEATQDGVPIVAFNAVFDVTVTDREMRRHGIGAVEPAGLRVVDPFVLDKKFDQYRKGKRTLTATCAHYGVALDGAHDASQDALAAARLAWRMAHRTPSLAGLSLDELHVMQVEAKAEQDRSYAAYLRRQAAQQSDVDEQIRLHAKADAVVGHWPLIPYQRQEGLG